MLALLAACLALAVGCDHRLPHLSASLFVGTPTPAERSADPASEDEPSGVQADSGAPDEAEAHPESFIHSNSEARADAGRPDSPWREVLARDGWTRTPPNAPDAPFRWQYPDLEALVVGGLLPSRALVGGADPAEPIIAANAAIAQSRAGEAVSEARLAAIATNPALGLAVRCAAIESLGQLAGPSIADALEQLLDRFGGETATVGEPHVDVLHEELLVALGRHIDAADSIHFAEALSNPAADVRLAALAAWRESQRGALPSQVVAAVVDLTQDPDYRVRIAAVATLVDRGHEQGPALLRQALQDYEPRVRVSAIEMLGQLEDATSGELLEKYLHSTNERYRAAAVKGMAARGEIDRALSAADDAQGTVRQAVAEVLARQCGERTIALARRMLEDRNLQVQETTLEALEAWPLADAGPVLIDALSHPSYRMRQLAAEQLGRRWPPAAGFPLHGTPAARDAAFAGLQAQWNDQLALAAESGGAEADRSGMDRDRSEAEADRIEAEPDEAALTIPQDTLDRVDELLWQLTETSSPYEQRRGALAALASFGAQLEPILETLVTERGRVVPEEVYVEVLPRFHSVYEALDRLAKGDARGRRLAAEELADRPYGEPLSLLALYRLSDIATFESDPLVWNALFAAVADDGREPSMWLAYAAIGAESAEVRRMACDHLAAHPSPRHAKVLLPALDDVYHAVARAAVRALGQPGVLDDTRPLERLLATPDPLLELDVATALSRLGVPSGPPALERLVYHADPKIRRQAIEAMGDVADPTFVPTLIAVLDEPQYGLKRAALASLPLVAGHDMGAPEDPALDDMAGRVERWKWWWDRESRRQGPLLR